MMDGSKYRFSLQGSQCFICLQNFNKNDPFFLFVNYMDAHGPYRPPCSFKAFPLPVAKKLSIMLLNYLGKGGGSTLKDFHLKQYDGEIAYLDHQLGELFAYLKKTGRYEKSLLIITSDHGELFGEHGF